MLENLNYLEFGKLLKEVKPELNYFFDLFDWILITILKIDNINIKKKYSTKLKRERKALPLYYGMEKQMIVKKILI